MNSSWLVCAVLVTSGCGARVEQQATDTNTNWLSSCGETADCGADLECLCGRCTVRCDQSEACENRDSKARCIPSHSCVQEAAVCGLPSVEQNNDDEQPPNLSESLCAEPIETYASLGECKSQPTCDTEGSAFFTDGCGCGCKTTSQCAWGVDAALAQVNIAATARVQCGSVYYIAPEIDQGFDCLFDSPTDPGAEFTVIDCIDCSIPSTYVTVPSGAHYRIYMEDDIHGGDDIRHVLLERCDSFDPSVPTRCVGPERLYECHEPRP